MAVQLIHRRQAALLASAISARTIRSGISGACVSRARIDRAQVQPRLGFAGGLAVDAGQRERAGLFEDTVEIGLAEGGRIA